LTASRVRDFRRRWSSARVGVGGDEVQQRERERSGLSRPRRGLAEDVATGEQRWDRLALHRSRLLVAERGERVDEPRIETERGESGALFGRRWCGGAWGHLTDARDGGAA
jgi:hypothetical protein